MSEIIKEKVVFSLIEISNIFQCTIFSFANKCTIKTANRFFFALIIHNSKKVRAIYFSQD